MFSDMVRTRIPLPEEPEHEIIVEDGTRELMNTYTITNSRIYLPQFVGFPDVSGFTAK